MKVSEYANDVNLSVAEILKKCHELAINVNNKDDYLTDDDIIMLDNTINLISTDDEITFEEEEDIEDKVDEIMTSSRVDKSMKDSISKEKLKKKDASKQDFNLKKKEMYKHKNKLMKNETDENIVLYKNGMSVAEFANVLNEFCLSTQQIRLRQPQVANIIEIISDIMLPLKDSWEDTSFYSWLLDNRYKLLEQEYWSVGYRRQESPEMPVINYEILYEDRNLYYEKKADKLSFYMDEFWVRGMSTEIARIMNTSRQNIDRYIISARIKERRTRDKAIFDLLGEDIWKTI